MTRSKQQMDMLHGSMLGKIFIFALPLMASGILQQSFNAVDVAIIGHYSTSQAIAAVGSNGMIISILVNLFLGIALGANVIIAQYIGQRNHAGVQRSVATVAVISVISGIFLAIAGVLLARPILEAMSAPEDVIDLATEYLRVYFLGMPFIMIFNFGSAILRSVGDTMRPFYALVVATVVNAVLDWFFVSSLDWGVAGVAAATVVANGVNALIIIRILVTAPDPITLNLKKLGVSGKDLGKILRIGIPAGVQGMIFSLSNIFIQASINKFGAYAVAGSAAALTFEAYCYYIITSVCAATIAFTGQNYGAGQLKRCKRVWAMTMAVCILASLAMNMLIMWQERACMSLFTKDPEVLKYAFIRIHTVLAFQCLASTYEVSGAYMRGLGYSVMPMLLTIFGTCVLRLLWVFTVAADAKDFGVLLSIYPISWAITGILVTGAAFIVQRKAFNKELSYEYKKHIEQRKLT